jgi:hypothetical protein
MSEVIFPESEGGGLYARLCRERMYVERPGRHAALRLASISLRLTRHSAI